MSALISPCGQYRYWLNRGPDNMFMVRPPALFVMLNPSTADATQDDPTIRRCRGFAESWGHTGFTVVNLYAYRATKPADLWAAVDPIGPDNDDHLYRLTKLYRHAVCAWGANAKPERVQQFIEIARKAGARLWCLGTTKDGAPRHPLYIKATQPLIPWVHHE